MTHRILDASLTFKQGIRTAICHRTRSWVADKGRSLFRWLVANKVRQDPLNKRPRTSDGSVECVVGFHLESILPLRKPLQSTADECDSPSYLIEPSRFFRTGTSQWNGHRPEWNKAIALRSSLYYVKARNALPNKQADYGLGDRLVQ